MRTPPKRSARVPRRGIKFIPNTAGRRTVMSNWREYATRRHAAMLLRLHFGTANKPRDSIGAYRFLRVDGAGPLDRRQCCEQRRNAHRGETGEVGGNVISVNRQIDD